MAGWTAAGSITRWLRGARWRASRASPALDRQFHDALFAAQAYDPFTPSYPGYVTIRRFADLAAARLGGVAVAADVGCGPGEITCELARRLPHVHFAGYDHSASAIERARTHAARLHLANVSFTVADAARLTLDANVEAVLLFDAFHHLTEPEAFLARQVHVSRWLLIEPAGDRLGRWRWEVDFDWVVFELDKVRQRFEAMASRVLPESRPASPVVPSPDDAAVERRYALEDFERFFTGFGVSVQGTVAGLMSYPPDPYSRSAERDRFGEFAYELLREADACLRAQDRDLGARHWFICAERGATGQSRRPARAEPAAAGGPAVQGRYDLEYMSCQGPDAIAPDAAVHFALHIRNNGWDTWRSDTQPPVLVSYHWLDRAGKTVVRDGVRSSLPQPLQPGESTIVHVTVMAPSQAGRYLLQFDLVHEGVTWFSEVGQAPFEKPCAVGHSLRQA